MMGPDPVRPPERSRERWLAWGWGRLRHRAELQSRPAGDLEKLRFQRDGAPSGLGIGPFDFCGRLRTLGSGPGLGFKEIKLLDEFFGTSLLSFVKWR